MNHHFVPSIPPFFKKFLHRPPKKKKDRKKGSDHSHTDHHHNYFHWEEIRNFMGTLYHAFIRVSIDIGKGAVKFFTWFEGVLHQLFVKTGHSLKGLSQLVGPTKEFVASLMKRFITACSALGRKLLEVSIFVGRNLHQSGGKFFNALGRGFEVVFVRTPKSVATSLSQLVGPTKTFGKTLYQGFIRGVVLIGRKVSEGGIKFFRMSGKGLEIAFVKAPTNFVKAMPRVLGPAKNFFIALGRFLSEAFIKIFKVFASSLQRLAVMSGNGAKSLYHGFGRVGVTTGRHVYRGGAAFLSASEKVLVVSGKNLYRGGGQFFSRFGKGPRMDLC